MKRRNFLALVGVATTTGCSTVTGVFGGTQHAGLGEMAVENFHTEAHTLRVQVESDGTLVTDRTFTLDGRAEGHIDSREVECGWAESAGPYVVQARHDPSTDWTSLVFEDEFDGSQVIGLTIRIGESGSDDAEIRYLQRLDSFEDCRAA